MEIIGQCRSTYFLHGKVIAVGTVPRTEYIIPRSYAYICRTCGDVWGRIAVDGGYWCSLQTPCPKHKPVGTQDWGLIPGSFISFASVAYDGLYDIYDAARLPRHLPHAVLKREFEVMYKWFQPEIENVAQE